jgi:hypothetical protein
MYVPNMFSNSRFISQLIVNIFHIEMVSQVSGILMLISKHKARNIDPITKNKYQ